MEGREKRKQRRLDSVQVKGLGKSGKVLRSVPPPQYLQETETVSTLVLQKH